MTKQKRVRPECESFSNPLIRQVKIFAEYLVRIDEMCLMMILTHIIVIVFDYCQSQKLAVVVIVLAIGKPVRDIVFLYSLISCFVVVFVHFSLFLL